MLSAAGEWISHAPAIPPGGAKVRPSDGSGRRSLRGVPSLVLLALRAGLVSISAVWGIHLTGVPSSEACPGRSYLGELSPRPAPMTFSYRSCSAYVNSPERCYWPSGQ